MKTYLQINRSMQTQAQDQFHSNSILCEFLSMAESLAYTSCDVQGIPYPLTLKYDKYDYGGTKNKDSYELLLKKVKVSYENFVGSFKDFERQHSRAYKYPINVPVEDVIQDLTTFSSYLDPSGKIAFGKMIEFFKTGYYNQVFEFNSGRSRGADPSKIAGRFPVASAFIMQGEERVRDEYARKGNYEFTAELNQRNDGFIRNQSNRAIESIQRDNQERGRRPFEGVQRYCSYCGKALINGRCLFCSS